MTALLRQDLERLDFVDDLLSDHEVVQLEVTELEREFGESLNVTLNDLMWAIIFMIKEEQI